VKPAPFAYTRPADLGAALEALSGASDAKVLAGGQSLVPLLSMRLAAPSLLVDINGLPDLDHVRSAADGVRVGALARHAAVLADEDALQVQPLLAMALANVAHATIRNRGTTVGSIVHADSAAELPVVLRLLGGAVDVVSARGLRTIGAEDLFRGPMESALEHDEIAVEAFLPALAPGAGVAFQEVARRSGDYALCGVAALVRLEDERIVEARLGYLSVCDVPTIVDVAAVVGDVLSDYSERLAGEMALESLDPQTDIHATADYRAQLVRVLTGRVLRTAYDDARQRLAVAS
jgi:2-furoyl-CoA dehydrogenase FAD binding subunit